MFRIIASALITLSFAGAADAQEEHGRYDFPVVVEGHEHILTYEGTHDVTRQFDPDVKLVIFVHHGGSQNPVTYFDNVKAALAVADAERPELELEAATMIIAPGMIGSHHIADDPERYSGGHYPHWTGSWREGARSVNSPEVSNYDLLDGLVLHVADQFSGVRAVVHIGHSAGGQLVSRYSVGTPVFETLRNRRIFVRYIISNPSSVVYFDRQRPDLKAEDGFIDYSKAVPVVDGEECPEFNDYKYGFDGELVEYMTRRPVEEMIADFREREVFMFQGLADNDPEHHALDRRCSGMLQGQHRLERGVRYYEYWGQFFGPDIYDKKFIEFVSGVNHSHGQMFVSEPGRSILFFDMASAIDLAGNDANQPDSPRRSTVVLP